MCALPLVVAQLFDTSPMLLKSLIYFLLLSKSSQYPGTRQCPCPCFALDFCSSVGCRAVNARGLGWSVFIVCNPIFSPAVLAVTNNPAFKPTGPEFHFLLHAREFLVVNFSEALSEAE